MTRVLFVDDEQQVLDGLRRILRPRTREWDVEFVNDPFAVLPMFESNPFDVVVTDMRMPGMDGLSLLRVVKARHPETIRIVLSGQVDHQTAVELLSVAHQYLSKPCDPDLLTDIVARAIELRSTLHDESLLGLVSALSSLPSMPALYAKLMRLVKSPDSSLAQVADVIVDDTAMTAKVLQLVNSAFFGLRRHVTDPRQAVTLLGLDNIVSLAMGAQVFTRMEHAGDAGISPEQEHDRAIAVATAAQAIARHEGVPDTDEHPFLLAGMLADSGKLALASNFPDRYRTVAGRLRDADDRLEAERAEFGATHADVGAYLLGVWGLPDAIIEAAAYHHSPSRSLIRRFGPLAAVHIADAVAAAGADEPDLDDDYLAACGVTARVDEWVRLVRPIFDELLDGASQEAEVA